MHDCRDLSVFRIVAYPKPETPQDPALVELPKDYLRLRFRHNPRRTQKCSHQDAFGPFRGNGVAQSNLDFRPVMPLGDAVIDELSPGHLAVGNNDDFVCLGMQASRPPVNFYHLADHGTARAGAHLNFHPITDIVGPVSYTHLT